MIAGQVALIVGGSGGIGRAVAISLADAGARVALTGRNRDRLDAARAALGSGAENAITVPCDITDRTQVADLTATVLSACGSIDILVCSAGLNIANRSLRSLTTEDWDLVQAVNVTGTFNVIHAVLPSMRERGCGLIIQLSSLSGLRPSAISGAAYSASKAAIAALGVCIGREERGRGIRSTVICAGEVDTPLLDARASRPGAGAPRRREGILQPGDIGALVRFIAESPPHVHIPEIVIKPVMDDFA